jgi:hypothetical protein
MSEQLTLKNPYPRQFSSTIAKRICERLIVGDSIRDICASGDHRFPSLSTFAKWFAGNKDFREMYHAARRVSAEIKVDEIFDIADDTSNDFVEVSYTNKNGTEVTRKVADNEAIQRSRVRIDTRKWYASKMMPKLYGDVETVKHELSDDFTKLLQSAANRDSGLPSGRIFDNE